MPRYYVQFEVEFDDAESVNDLTMIKAANEEEAMKAFVGDGYFEVWPDATAITSNAAWPV